MPDTQRDGSDVVLALEPPESSDAGACMTAYFAELAQRFDAGFDPARSNPADEADLAPPRGWLVLARLDGVPVGCGALKRLDDGGGEVKRMWTDPRVRGRGVARRILARLEELAVEAGLDSLRLETNRNLKEAQAMYRARGYREVPAFNDEPYAHHWFRKELPKG